AIVAPLARVAEIWAMRRTAGTLLDTHVGPHTGERILAGQIQRGDIEEIHAAIWLSDMRGFTAWTDSIPPRPLIDLLNRYFDCQVPTIFDNGGEVLTFMGGGRWAMGDLSDRRRRCQRGRSLPPRARRRPCGAGECRGAGRAGRDRAFRRAGFRLALHLGEVLYCNIGSGNRLDFT